MNDELYHHGVKGQKWGVRKDRKTLLQRGSNFINKMKTKKVMTIVSSTAAVASGALWVASALVPGVAALNTVAAVANVASMATAPK